MSTGLAPWDPEAKDRMMDVAPAALLDSLVEELAMVLTCHGAMYGAEARQYASAFVGRVEDLCQRTPAGHLADQLGGDPSKWGALPADAHVEAARVGTASFLRKVMDQYETELPAEPVKFREFL